MLVLSRKFGESIVIGEGDKQVTVTVVQIYRDQVRLGIEAPPEVPVHRKEVADEIAAERARTAETAGDYRQTDGEVKK